MRNIRHDKDWFDHRVEPYIDGDLSDQDCRDFEKQLSDDADLLAQVQAALTVKELLGAMPIHEIPQDTLVAIRNRTRQKGTASVDPVDSLRLVRYSKIRKTVFVGGAIAACIALAIFLTSIPYGHRQHDSHTPSEAEISRALNDVKWTLALVSDMGHERSEIVNNHVVEPVHKAMNFVVRYPDADQRNSTNDL